MLFSIKKAEFFSKRLNWIFSRRIKIGVWLNSVFFVRPKKLIVFQPFALRGKKKKKRKRDI